MRVISKLEGSSLADAKSTLRRWIRKLLYCNPFYLISAALLLYGVYHISVHSDFLTAPIPKLVFNFSSLQFYEVLLLTTAILLARARIGYDSTLLVGLENFFVLIPFLLLSQAVLIDSLLAWVLGGLAVVFAFWRFVGLKHLIPDLNMPLRLLGFGFVLLLLNFALPVTLVSYRESNNPLLGSVLEYAWLLGLPMTAALAILLPRPVHRSSHIPELAWLPGLFFLIWIAVSAAHLWTVGFVYDFEWALPLLAPLTWVVMWTLVLRLTDLHPNPSPINRQILLGLPACATLLAANEAGIVIFFALSFLNVLAYGTAFAWSDCRKTAIHLMLISIAASVAGMPESVGEHCFEYFSRGTCVQYSIASYMIAGAALSKNPKVGFIGAIVCGFTAVSLLSRGFLPHGFFQGVFVYYLLHSLRWEDEKIPGAKGVRIFFAITWALYSFLWVYFDGYRAMTSTALLGVLVLGSYVLVSWLRHCWRLGVLPLCAFMVLSSTPLASIAEEVVWIVRKLVEFILNLPTGLLAILASLMLFAFGTWVAFAKRRWKNPSGKEFRL